MKVKVTFSDESQEILDGEELTGGVGGTPDKEQLTAIAMEIADMVGACDFAMHPTLVVEVDEEGKIIREFQGYWDYTLGEM